MQLDNFLDFFEEENFFYQEEINDGFKGTNPIFLFKNDFDILSSPLNEEDNNFINKMNSREEPSSLESNFRNNSLKSFIENENNNQNEYHSTFNTSKNNDNCIYKNINFKTVLRHKRGRKEKDKKIGKKYHGSGDFDNIQRKIQVSFFNFLIKLANDAIKTVLGEDTKFCFEDVKYKFKKVVSHDYLEKLKKSKFSDILNLDVSPKKRSYSENSNKKTFTEVCMLSPELKKLFESNYLYLFQKYFCEIEKNLDIIEIEGFKIKLSKNTKTLFDLLNKNNDQKEKFIDVVKNVYFSGLIYKNENIFKTSNTFVISHKEKKQNFI